MLFARVPTYSISFHFWSFFIFPCHFFRTPLVLWSICGMLVSHKYQLAQYFYYKRSLIMRKPEIRGGLLVFLVYLFATCIATLGMYFSITDYVFYNTVHAWLCILVFFLKAAGIVFFFRRSSFFPNLHAGYEILWLILYLSIDPSRYPSHRNYLSLHFRTG